MPAFWHVKSMHIPNIYASELSQVAQLHSGKLPHCYGHFQPYMYIPQISSKEVMPFLEALTLHSKLDQNQRDSGGGNKQNHAEERC